MSSSIVAPSGQTPATNAQDVAFLKAQVERAQSTQTLYLVLLLIAFVVAMAQTLRLRRLLNLASTPDPWAAWNYYR